MIANLFFVGNISNYRHILIQIITTLKCSGHYFAYIVTFQIEQQPETMNEGTFMTTLQITHDQLLARIQSAFDKVGGELVSFETPLEVRILFYSGNRQRFLSIPASRREQRLAHTIIGENYRVQLTFGEQGETCFARFGLYDAKDASEPPSLVCTITYLCDPRFGIERKIKIGGNIDGPQPFDTLGRFYRDLLEFFKLTVFIEG